MKLDNKVALITGAGSGIGAAIAKRFVEDGAKICIIGRRKKNLEDVASQLPSGKVKVFPGDITKHEDVRAVVKSTIEWGGKLDVLVNNAAINPEGGVAEVDLNDWQAVLSTNLNAPFLLMREVIPHMKEKGGGSVINIASLGGLRCLSGRVAYCTTKAALIMLTKQAAADYGKYNIRFNAVCPGFVFTEMTRGHFGEFGKGNLGPFKNIPLKRGAEPEEITGICSYLASDDSGFMTGSVLLIDGGTAVVDAFDAGLQEG